MFIIISSYFAFNWSSPLFRSNIQKKNNINFKLIEKVEFSFF